MNCVPLTYSSFGSETLSFVLTNVFSKSLFLIKDNNVLVDATLICFTDEFSNIVKYYFFWITPTKKRLKKIQVVAQVLPILGRNPRLQTPKLQAFMDGSGSIPMVI